MQCPVCPDERLAIADRQGIEIDYCPSCRGIWLDRGELDKLVERAAGVPEPARAPAQPYDRYRDDRYRDDRPVDPKRKKKSSFLGDLLDF